MKCSFLLTFLVDKIFRKIFNYTKFKEPLNNIENYLNYGGLISLEIKIHTVMYRMNRQILKYLQTGIVDFI